MSHATHANAALTPRARLRLARLIVDHGWPPARAAERYDVSWRTAKKWADRYREEGPAGMLDRSSAPHRQPNRTPAPVVRKIVHLRWKQRLGPVEIADRLDMASSTVHAVLVRCRINRLTHIDRATGEPIRRYEHEKPGDLIHVDVKKLGKIPDGGGWRYLGRQQGEKNRAATAARTGSTQQVPRPDYRDLLPAHRDRRPLPRRLRRGPRRRNQGDRDRGPPATRSPGSPTAASPSNASSATTAAATSPTSGATPAPTWASHRRRPGPTDHRPTARSNASTAPWPRAGRSRSSTTPNQPDSQLCQHGSTSTTTTGPTQQSGRPHPSPGWTTWLGITSSAPIFDRVTSALAQTRTRSLLR